MVLFVYNIYLKVSSSNKSNQIEPSKIKHHVFNLYNRKKSINKMNKIKFNISRLYIHNNNNKANKYNNKFFNKHLKKLLVSKNKDIPNKKILVIIVLENYSNRFQRMNFKTTIVIIYC